MSEGIRLSYTSSQTELDNLKGARLLQVAVPSEKYYGFHLTNHDGTVKSVSKNGELVQISLDTDDNLLTFRSAVLTYELTSLKGIARFHEKDN